MFVGKMALYQVVNNKMVNDKVVVDKLERAGKTKCQSTK
jgi:hypothetical protein